MNEAPRHQAVGMPACQCVRTLWHSTRPPFLLLTLSIMFLTAALLQHAGGPWPYDAYGGHVLYRTPAFWLALIAALAAHVSVNLFNEAGDWRSGLDRLTRPTPFSGGSGALKACPDCLETVENGAWFALGMVISIGLYLVFSTGWLLLLFGLVGVGLIILYTPVITRYPLAVLVAPGLAFGPVMMWGTALAVGHGVPGVMIPVALAVFFLVNNLLLLNQLPDQEADRQVGRRNVVILAGVPMAIRIYEVFQLAALALLLLPVVSGRLPLAALWGVGLSVVLAGSTRFFLHLWQRGNEAALQRALALNTLQVLVVPAVLAWVLFRG